MVLLLILANGLLDVDELFELVVSFEPPVVLPVELPVELPVVLPVVLPAASLSRAICSRESPDI